MKKLTYKHTMYACFIGYIVQSIACNFAPLLFVGWNNEFSISMGKITTIVTLTFFVQIIVDIVSAKYVDKIGYKASLMLAHIFSAVGFVCLGTLPYVIKNAFVGIVISVILYSIGSGLLEVLVSPVVDYCPSENKSGAMSLLHSFYCWGTVGVIAVSTLYFTVFGRENWRYLAFFWALFALCNAVFFSQVPIVQPPKEKKDGKIGSLFKSKSFLISILLMICAGAGELAMSQWVSTFAERGLNVSKSVGDLAGPMAFAVLMGTGRVVFSKVSNKVSTKSYLIFSSILCIFSYIIASLSSNSVISLIGCALCGFAVSAMWPATISLTSKQNPNGGTALFAILAVAGDIGCTAGPTVIGTITDTMDGDIKKGLIFGAIFPALIIFGLLFQRDKKQA